MQQPLCETCIHRDRIAGGRGDCTVRMWDTLDYALIASGVQRYCVHRREERTERQTVHPDQLELKL